MKGVCRTNQLKRSLIVSAILYEYYGWSFISDAEWDKRALELKDRIENGLDTNLFKDLFKGWKGETGMHLIHSEWGKVRARYFNNNREYFDRN